MTSVFKLFPVFILTALLWVSSCAESQQTLLDVLEAYESHPAWGSTLDVEVTNFDIMANLLKLASLEDLTLGDEGDGYTFFIPNDDAFMRTTQDLGLNSSTESDAYRDFFDFLSHTYNNPVTAVQQLIAYHTLPGKLDIVLDDPSGLENAQLDSMLSLKGIYRNNLTLIDGNPNLPDPKILYGLSREISKSIVHVIDRVLFFEATIISQPDEDTADPFGSPEASIADDGLPLEPQTPSENEPSVQPGPEPQSSPFPTVTTNPATTSTFAITISPSPVVSKQENPLSTPSPSSSPLLGEVGQNPSPSQTTSNIGTGPSANPSSPSPSYPTPIEIPVVLPQLPSASPYVDSTELIFPSDQPLLTDEPLLGDGSIGAEPSNEYEWPISSFEAEEPTPEPSLEPSPECFPASATVILPGGSPLSISALSAGDEVLVSDKSASSVYLFTHRELTGRRDFVKIKSSLNHSISLTQGHYIYANEKLQPAGYVRIGDTLRTIDGTARVTAVEWTVDEGLIAPHTMQGDIVVNRIIVSTYTAAVHANLAHISLWPIRTLARLGIREPLGSLLYQGLPKRWIPSFSRLQRICRSGYGK